MKSTFNKYRTLIPLIILTGISILTAVTLFRWDIEMPSFNFDYLFIKKYISALMLLVINYIVFFKFGKFYKYTFSLALLLGLADIINFSIFDLTWTFNIGQLGFKPTAFIIGLLTYLLNFKRVHRLLRNDNLKTFEKKLEREKKERDSKINELKKDFANYTNDELNEILKEKKYAFEANRAARELLSERQNNIN